MKAPSNSIEHTLELAGAPVHYLAAGSGEIVVLIHGSLCDYRYWRWQLPAFSEDFHVIAPSLPGCWPTTEPRDISGQSTETRFSMKRHIQAVVELCQRLSPDRPVRLLGHSRGAQVALEAALVLKDQISHLVLADPGFPFSDEDPVQPVHVEIAKRLGSAPLEEVIGEFVDTVNGPGTWRQTVSWFKEMVYDNAWTLVPQTDDIHRSIDSATLVRNLRCPLLLLGGEFSPQRYGSRIQKLMAALPHARHVVVPKAAHGMSLANARYFNDAVLSFLRKS